MQTNRTRLLVIMAAYDTLDRLSSHDFALWASALADLDTAQANQRRTEMENRFFAALDAIEDAVSGLDGDQRAAFRERMEHYKKLYIDGGTPGI